jgi:hypothetical protein
VTDKKSVITLVSGKRPPRCSDETKRKKSICFGDLNVGWVDEDFESTEIVFLNDETGNEKPEVDFKVESESSVCSFCHFYAGSLFEMRNHVVGAHLVSML